jgi:hypothetical protein
VWRPTGGGQPYPGTRGDPTGGVSEAKRRVPARSRSFPCAFKVMRPWLSQGKNMLANREAMARTPTTG